MRRVRITKPKVRRDRSWLEVLSLDPRDPDIVRAKTIDRAGDQQSGTTSVSRSSRDRR